AVHLIALGIGLPAVWLRGRALQGPLDDEALNQVFRTDSVWGIAALLWITTGVIRAFSGLEKGSAYYLSNTAFLIKMGLLAIVLLLEVWPMTTLIGWRVGRSRGQAIDTSQAGKFAIISRIQAFIIVLMVFAATAMARGLG